jgi:hypothetical protein
MSLLAVEGRGKPHIYRIEVDGPTDAELRLYARYSNNTTVENVAKAALKHMVEKLFPTDEKFQTWKQNPENLAPPAPRNRRQIGNGAGSTATAPPLPPGIGPVSPSQTAKK